MEIGEPTVLIKLPRAGITGEGRTQFGQVFGVRDGQRKKRHEICAAVDGNSINIYEINNGRNLTSWPVPPDSVFVSAPVSERILFSTTNIVRRVWCAVKRRDQTSIVCYEHIKKDGQSTSTTSTFALKNNSTVVKLGRIDAVEKLVVAVQADGTLSLFSSDNKREIGTFRLAAQESVPKVLTAYCSSIFATQKTFLKSRSDISAGLSLDSISIACVYERPQNEGLYFGIWTLSLNTVLHEKHEALYPAVSHSLGLINLSNHTKRSGIEICGGTRLEIKNAAHVATYDLTTIVPQRLADFKQPLVDCTSDIEISHSLRLCANSTNLQVYNKDFGSILASSELNTSILKRKRDQDGARQFSFIAYFSQMRRVLAFIGSQIFAVDIHANDSSAFKQSSLLIGNILRGAERKTQDNEERSSKPVSIGKYHSEETVPNWPLMSKELDSLVDKNDPKRFEEVFKNIFNLQRAKDLNSSRVPDSKIDYLLSKIFAVAAVDGKPDQKRLKILFLPYELMQWSISSGYVDNHRVDQALQDKVTSRRPDAIALALADIDPSLSLVEYYIKNAPFLDPEVLRLCIHVFMRKILQTEEDGQAAAKSVAATNCLLHALKRFAFTGSSVVSKQLRDFDRAIILPIIQVLRQQMFLGGYGRLSHSYPSPAPSEDGKSGTNNQLDLTSIVILLNGCVDAIGPVGIFGTDDVWGSVMQRVVPELVSEVSAACEGVQDSIMLQGLVRETLRYSESIERQPFEVRQKAEAKVAGKGAIKGQVVTLYAEPDEEEGGIESGSALPLSLKAPEDLNGMKVRKGGQVHKRSAREMGALKDRLRSAYSFERLIL